MNPDAEGTERFRVWVRRSFHQIVFDMAAEFLAEKKAMRSRVIRLRRSGQARRPRRSDGTNSRSARARSERWQTGRRLYSVGEISKIHRFQLQPGGRLRSIAPTYVNSVLELTFVLGGIEMAFGFCDESVVVEVPKFIAADANAFSRAARTGVGSR